MTKIRNLAPNQTLTKVSPGLLYNQAMQPLLAFGKSLSLCLGTADYMLQSYLPKADLSSLKQQWASDVLKWLGVELEIKGSVSQCRSILFVGNHVSYLDIPLLMKSVYGISFVAKREIEKWPLFGQGAKRLDTIFVERENKTRRGEARKSIAHALEIGKRVALFPSGTTSMNEQKDWRRGPFEIAQKHAACIQPFRIRYSPLRSAAFIDDDALLPHMTNLMMKAPIQAQIEFHPPVSIEDPEACRQKWQDWCRVLPLS